MSIKINHFLLILVAITLAVTLMSKIEVINAQIADPELKHLLSQAKSLASNSMNDNYKDKVFSPPHNTKDLWDICHTQTENNPRMSDPDRHCFNIIIDKCQKNNLSAEECYAASFVSFKADDIDIAVLNSANAKLKAHTSALGSAK